MERENRLYRWIRIIIAWITFAVVALPVKHYVMAIVLVKNHSMYPTLKDSEFVLVSRTNRLTMADYEIGDIIMFEAPSDTKTIEDMFFGDPIAEYDFEPEGTLNRIIYYGLEATKLSYVKRIVAVGGDTLEFKDSKLYVNDVELVEDYLPEGTITEPRGISCALLSAGAISSCSCVIKFSSSKICPNFFV